MSYSTYFEAYYIIGFIICIPYLMYKTLTAEADDDIEKAGFFTLMLFFLFPVVIPIALFVWIQKKKNHERKY